MIKCWWSLWWVPQTVSYRDQSLALVFNDMWDKGEISKSMKESVRSILKDKKDCLQNGDSLHD